MRVRKFLLLIFTCPLFLLKLLLRRLRFSRAEMKGKKTGTLHGVHFEYDFDYAPNIQRMYFGLYEPLVVRVLEKFLKEGDVFIDVGANIGYLTAAGAGLVGRTGSVYSFEPSLREFSRLQKMAALNPGYDIQCFNVACGEKESTQPMHISSAFGWNTLVPNWMRPDVYESTSEVDIVRLDEFLLSRIDAKKIKLIKIDVEGYEYYVLKGLARIFETAKPAVLCEVTPRGMDLLGLKLETLDLFMKEMGYSARSLINPKLRMDLANLNFQEDILFLPENYFSNSRMTFSAGKR